MDIVAMIFGLQFARQINFGASDVAMNVDTTGHHDHTLGVDAFCFRRYAFYNLAILYADIAYFPIHVVGRVVDSTIDDAEHRRLKLRFD